jgi:hypothetical protein
MPEVEVVPPEQIEAVFKTARKTASGEAKLPNDQAAGHRFLVLVTPKRMLMQAFCPPAGSLPPEQVAPMEKMLPPAAPRHVAVIAYTGIKAIQSDLSQAIPFVGLLMGLAYIGHAVWIFEGHPTALAAGCQDADLLLVDGGMVPFLQDGWPGMAASVMGHREIYVHDRAAFQLKRLAIR